MVRLRDLRRQLALTPTTGRALTLLSVRASIGKIQEAPEIRDHHDNATTSIDVALYETSCRRRRSCVNVELQGDLHTGLMFQRRELETQIETCRIETIW